MPTRGDESPARLTDRIRTRHLRRALHLVVARQQLLFGALVLGPEVDALADHLMGLGVESVCLVDPAVARRLAEQLDEAGVLLPDRHVLVREEPARRVADEVVVHRLFGPAVGALGREPPHYSPPRGPRSSVDRAPDF